MENVNTTNKIKCMLKNYRKLFIKYYRCKVLY